MPHSYRELPFEGSEEVREDLARGGLKTSFTLLTPGGWKTIDSPWEPRGEASRTLDKLTADVDAILLLGSGSGFFAEEMVAREVTHVLIVGASRTLCQRTIKRLEKSGAVPDGCDMVIASGSDAETLYTEVVSPWLKQHPNAAIVKHPREFQAVPAFYESLAARLVLRDHAPATPVSRDIQRVLLLGNGGLMEPEVASAFAARGITVLKDSPLTGRRMTAETALELIERHKPDAVFSTNLLGSDLAGVFPEMCEQLGIPWATWLLDDPRFLLTPEAAAGAGRQRLALCWDENGIDGWHELGFDHAEPLPLATSPDAFTGAKADPSLAGRIVFVGSPMFASAEGFFHLLDQDEKAALIADQLAPEIERTRRPPAPERIRELIAAEGLEGHFEPESERRLAPWAMQRANRAYRARMINSLAAFRPIVYGTGWERLLDSGVELRPAVGYDEQLPSLYASDAVHLSLTNLQMRSWPNQRLFDIPAAGGCVLTDRLSGLDQLFGDSILPLVFDGEEQLAERVNTLLDRPELRREQANTLREIVRERHTVQHRVDRLLEIWSE